MAIDRRLGASESVILAAQGNLASTYQLLEMHEDAMRMQRDVYSGRLNINGEEDVDTLREANNYASSLNGLGCFEEAKSLLRKTVPVARRVLGERHELTLTMRWTYAQSLHLLSDDDDSTLDDLREAVATFEDSEGIARRVLGGAHPLVANLGRSLRLSRANLGAREGNLNDVNGLCDAVAAMAPGDA